MQQHRLTERLTSYWENARKEAPIPEFSRFNSSAIEDIWQQCILFVVQPLVADKPPAVNFYKVGEKLRSIYKTDLTGQTVNTAQRHFEGAKIVSRIADVIAEPRPLLDEGQFVNGTGKLVKYRSCLLPFGDETRVTHIVAGLSWREF